MVLDSRSIFLSSLSPGARRLLVSHSTSVELPFNTVLYESAILPRSAYFLTSGIASVVTITPEGETAEVGFIGREGVVGSLHLLGPTCISSRCMMQLTGAGLRIPLLDLQAAFDTCEEIRNRILEFTQEQSAMVAQIAGCNRLHDVEQRLSRWLLMAQDRTQSNTLMFTQEYLAGMIGSQRTTVTGIALALQGRGLVSYSRGAITILNRTGLVQAACGCYPVIELLYSSLYRSHSFPTSA